MALIIELKLNRAEVARLESENADLRRMDVIEGKRRPPLKLYNH